MDRVTELIANLKHPDLRVRYAAAADLGQIGSPAVPALMEALKDTSEYVRIFAADTLGQIRDPQAVPALTESLEDRNRPVRMYASRALMEIGFPAVPALIVALQDTDANVRQSAALALGGIDDPRVVPALIVALQDTDAMVRLFSAVALGGIASRNPHPALRDALPTLRRLRTRNLLSVSEVQKAIDQIEAATAGMKDLPLPASAPEPDAASLPLPSIAPAPSPDDLPIPAASAVEIVASLQGKRHNAMTRSLREWLMREKRH